MILLDEDVKRISELGFEESFFTRSTADGFKILKNSSAGRCVFHDGSKCTIYEHRPKGCKLYPVIYDEDQMLAVKDMDCPYRNEFELSRRSKRELSYVYSRIMAETASRFSANGEIIRDSQNERE
jgi:uncharacterized protein